MTPEPYYQSLKDFVAKVSKLTEGKTPEEIEAWKADIDRARHPFDYIERPSDALQAKDKADASPPDKEKDAS
jgi:hypothetical protein